MNKQLMAGVTKVNITPPVGVDLSGYADRLNPSVGIHDDLYAKALVLSDQQNTVAIITCDLIGVDKQSVNTVRGLVEGQTQISKNNIMISASHTHSGPTTLQLRHMGKILGPYLYELERKLAGAVYMAANNLQPVKIGVGKGEAGFGVNRRLKGEEVGVVLGPNIKGPWDNEVGVIRIDGQNDNPLAVLINYTCHAVVLGGDNLLISADYPGYAMGMVENVLDVIALFTNGACGNINPHRRGGFEVAKRLGYWLGGEVVKVGMQISSSAEAQISVKSATVKLPLKSLPALAELQKIIQQEEQLLKGSAKLAHWEQVYHQVQLEWAKEAVQIMQSGAIQTEREIELQALIIDDIALVAISGELFVEWQLKIKQNSRFANTFVVGYANGCIGYVPTEEAFEEGGYEPDESYKYYGVYSLHPKAGEVLYQNVLKLLK